MNLSFPSINSLIWAAKQTFKRFPIVIFVALLAGLAVIVQIEWEPFSQRTWWQLFYPMVLLIPLTFLISLFLESKLWTTAHKMIFSAVCLTAFACYALSPAFSSNQIHEFRFFQLFLAFHLLIAAAPHLRHSSLKQFWKFNENLFTRFILTTVYSGFICAGLLICLGSYHYLFGNHVHEKIYFDIFVAIAFGFHPWFFLSGVAFNHQIESDRLDYPTGIKVFTQYVLIPLVSIYLVILYLYLGKVIVLMQWPKGNVGWLVSSFSVVGMLCLLLLHPIQEQTENRWIKSFGRFFYLALLPLVVLLVAGTWKRIDSYGITEKRYLLMTLGLWITTMSIIFGLLRKKNIKWIPITLGALCLLSSFGPWGAYSVSFHSQWNRLQKIWTEYHLLENGKVRKATIPIPHNTRVQLSSILDYLNGVHSTEVLQPYFNGSYNEEIQDQKHRKSWYWSSYEVTEKMMKEMGLNYTHTYDSEGNEREGFNWYRANTGNEGMRISGYDYLLHISLYKYAKNPSTESYKIENQSITLTFTDQAELIVKVLPKEVVLPLTEIAKQAKENVGTPGAALEITKEQNGLKASLIPESINGYINIQTGQPQISNLSGRLLIQVRN